MPLDGSEHLTHIAVAQARGQFNHQIEEAALLADDIWAMRTMARYAAVFFSAFEFGLRFSLRHPNHVRLLLDWLDTLPDPNGEPLEMRERAMAEDADKVLRGCDHEEVL